MLHIWGVILAENFIFSRFNEQNFSSETIIQISVPTLILIILGAEL